MRLQVFLSHAGICSRRKALDVVKSSRVRVNGQIVKEPSYKIDPSCDKVEYLGKPVVIKQYIYVVFHKPVGVTTTKKDKHAEKILTDILPESMHHLNPVGRLDKDSSGLLMLTNDGGLNYKLTHPKFEVKKIYQITLNKKISPEVISEIESGVKLEEGITAPCKIRTEGKFIFITIHEGKKRQIRRMFAAKDLKVNSLKRIQEGAIKLGNLKPGQWRNLSQKEISRLQCH